MGLSHFFTLAEDINLPVKHTKTVLPTTCALVNGVEIDTIALELRLPQDKLCNHRSMLSKLSKKRTVELKKIQSILGLLAFACSVLVPGRAFLRRLYNLTCGPFGFAAVLGNKWISGGWHKMFKSDDITLLEFFSYNVGRGHLGKLFFKISMSFS